MSEPIESNDKNDEVDESSASNQRQVFRAAGIVAIAFVFSRLLGLGREVVIRAYYGVDTIEATAYALANRFPDLIFNVVVGGALASAFIPTFAAYFVKEDEKGGWKLFSAVINIVLVVTTVLAGLVALFAPQLVVFFLPVGDGDNSELLSLTVRMMRVMLISTVIFGVSGVFMGALQARQHFTAPAFAASIYNLGIIVGTVVLAPNAMGLAYGAVLGALGHAAIQLPVLRRQGARFAPIFAVGDGGVRQVFVLMGPRVLGLSFSYLNRFVLPLLTRPLILGSLPALDNAFQVMLMPYSILGQAIGTAAFPTLSMLAAKESWGEMRQILATALRSILFLGLPITAGLMLLSRPLVSVLFERGAFDADDTALVAVALLFYSLALIALAWLDVTSRAFYALGDTATPVVAGMVQLPLMLGMAAFFAYVLFPMMGWPALGGIALGFSVSNWLETVVLLWLLRGRIGGVNGGDLLSGLGQMGLATAVMGAAVWGVSWLTVGLHPVFAVAAGGAVGVAVYFAVCWLLGVREVLGLVATVLRRLGRS